MSKWIKCSEQLPNKDGYYLTWKSTDEAYVYEWCEGWNCYRTIDGSVSRKYEIKNIVAWQEIEPFEEDNNEHRED